MPLFQYISALKFKKTGREIKAAIEPRITELRQRLSKRDRELDEVMNDKTLLRSFLVGQERTDYPRRNQAAAEMPTEEHQRITELCRRINLIEQEISGLSVVRDNLKDDQELELSYEDLIRLGFSPEHFGTTIG